MVRAVAMKASKAPPNSGTDSDDRQTKCEMIELEFPIGSSKQKSIERKKNCLIELYGEGNNLDIALGTKPNRVSTQEKRENVKLKIEWLEQHKERAVKVRDRAEWIEKNDKNTNFFLI